MLYRLEYESQTKQRHSLCHLFSLRRQMCDLGLPSPIWCSSDDAENNKCYADQKCSFWFTQEGWNLYGSKIFSNMWPKLILERGRLITRMINISYKEATSISITASDGIQVYIVTPNKSQIIEHSFQTPLNRYNHG